MPIKIKTMARKNLQDQAAPAKHYAIVDPSGKTDLNELSALIADKCTVSRPDVYAVIIAATEVIMKEIAAGRSVQFGILGSFGVSISSVGKATPEEVTASSVKSAKVLYRAGPEIKDLIKNLKFEKKS